MLETQEKYNNSRLLAPNGMPSNLTIEQYHLVRTPEFKAWFGDWENSPETASKVIDENGEPLVFYHGSIYDFTEFKKEFINDFDVDAHINGFWLTTNKETSPKGTNANYVKPYFLSIKNPIPKKLASKIYNEIEEYKNYGDNFSTHNKVREIAESRGYDCYFLNLPKRINISFYKKNGFYKEGNWEVRKEYSTSGWSNKGGVIQVAKHEVVAYYLYDSLICEYETIKSFEESHKEIVVAVFNPNQIKLADGTNTTFDSETDDIRFEDGGIIENKEETYRKWSSLVNMTFSELKSFYDSEEGKEAGMRQSDADKLGIDSGRESARWIMKMKKINYSSWTPEMWRWAKKQISFISRMRGNKGSLFDEKDNKTRKHLSLLIWGHNPLKGKDMKKINRKSEILDSAYYEKGGSTNTCESFDSNGERKTDRESIKKLTECILKLPQTKDLNVDKNGNYTPERKALHLKIMNEFKKNLVCIDNDNPIAIFMGGSPASGKSTFLRKYRPFLLESEILKVDADEIRSKLPEYKGFNATQTQAETKDIVSTLLSDKTIGIPCDFDIIYDGTMNSVKSYLPLIELLKNRGYKIFIVYIDNVPYDTVVERMLSRYKKSGRFVPIEVIDDFFSKGKSAMNTLQSEVDGYLVVDGSDSEYRILEEGGMKLPETRMYSKLGRPLKELQEFKVGGNLKPNFVLYAQDPKSINGRSLSPFPKMDYSTNRKALASEKKFSQWLLDNAREEVKNDSYKSTFIPKDISNLSPADMDMLNLFLFNSSSVRINYDTPPKQITCSKCSWSWKENESEAHDLYNCHKCGHDNKKMEQGGTMENYDKIMTAVRYKFNTLLDLNDNFDIMTRSWALHPYKLVNDAVMRGFISVSEINKNVLESAVEECEDAQDDEEIGSSDMTYKMQSFLKNAGFKVEFKDSRLTRFDDEGNPIKVQAFKDGGVIENEADIHLVFDGDIDKITKLNKEILLLFPETKPEIGMNGKLECYCDEETCKQIESLAKLFKTTHKFGEGGSTATSVASIIVNQLGGFGRLKMMLGARNLSSTPNSLSFRIGNRKVNYVKITLNSMDLYDVEFGRISGDKYKVVSKSEAVYAEDLIPVVEKGTGMYLRLAKGGNIGHTISFRYWDGKIHEAKIISHTEDGYEVSTEKGNILVRPQDIISIGR